MRKIFLLFFLPFCAISAELLENKKVLWPFEGIFGTVDREAARRGFQVYREVCASCHGIKRFYYRDLKGLGFSEEEIKEIAKSYQVQDGPDNSGEMFQRPGLPSDHFVSPFPNEEAARFANNGAYPLDLSLIIKSRHDGANYLFSLLTGYRNPPAGFNLMEGLYYNEYFPGHQIAMPPPLSDNRVTYEDGTNATVEQMARDVVVFLQYAAEPEMENRKSMGLKVMTYLTIFTALFYLAKRKIWNRLK